MALILQLGLGGGWRRAGVGADCFLLIFDTYCSFLGQCFVMNIKLDFVCQLFLDVFLASYLVVNIYILFLDYAIFFVSEWALGF